MRWILLYECKSEYDLQQKKTSIISLINRSGASGFSLRYGADIANPTPGDWTPLHRLVAIAAEISKACNNCEVQLRMMYGRRTPEHGAARLVIYSGPPLGGTDTGMRNFPYPLAVDAQGNPEIVFKRWRRRAQRRTVAECLWLREQDIPCDIVHGSHLAGTWAEPFFVDHMMGFEGFDWDVQLEEDVATIVDFDNIWDGMVEFAMSGHWPTDQAVRGYLTKVLSSTLGATQTRITNRNDIRNPGHTNFTYMPKDRKLAFQSYSSVVHPVTKIPGYYYNGQWVNYDWLGIRRECDKLPNLVYYEAYPANVSDSLIQAFS